MDASVKRLLAAGFTKLTERDEWQLERGGSYYFTRNGTTVLAFTVGSHFPSTAGTFTVLGAHTDSPCLKIKPVLFLFTLTFFSIIIFNSNNHGRVGNLPHQAGLLDVEHHSLRWRPLAHMV